MRTRQDARLAAGDDRALMIAVANPGGANLTGLSAKYIVASAAVGPALSAPIIQKQTGAGIEVITTGVPAGYAVVLKVTLANNDTDDVPPGWYYHEATMTLTNDSTVTVMTGQLRIDPSWIASTL